MIGGSENPLYPQGAQQLSPYLAYKFTASVREEPTRGAEVGDHMAQEGFVHRVCSVIARRNEDGIPRVAIDKHNEELLAVIGRQRSHNVYRQRVPWPLRLDGPRRLLMVAMIAAQLTLGTTLCDFKANAATGFVVIAIAEELPQRLSAEVGSRVELSCEISSFILIF